MKATLEFNLPEESEEFELATNGTNISLALWKFTQFLRNLDKYGFDEKDPKFENPSSTISYIREQFLEIINEYEIKL
jgi:hypothetical protein